MSSAETLPRAAVPVESTWNSAALYPDWAAWETDYETAIADLPALSDFAGTLGSGPDVLTRWFAEHSRQWRRLMKLFSYARMSRVVDTSDAAARTHYGQAGSLWARFAAATAFADPELLAVGDTLLDWATMGDLAIYRHHFENLLRLRPHRRSGEVEEVLSMLGEVLDGPHRTANELTNSDLQFADAVDSQGRTQPVRQATITPSGIQSPDREQRRTAWESFSDAHLALENTLASNFITSVQQQVFQARVRGYDSVLEMMLAPTNLPTEVFHNVINTFRQQLPVWHRYWEVKRRILSVDALHPYDIWAPVQADSPRIPYRQAVEWIAASLAPLGQPYVDVLRRGCLEERWVDYAANVGKMQGAASSLAVESPPFIFMTYDESPMAMSVLAHELGHSLHLYFTDQSQPDVYNSFDALSSTVTETASNFNQAMLRAYLRKEAADNQPLQIALLDEALFNFHRYFFTMPILARFEFEAYSRAEQNQPLSAAILKEIMRDLYAEGYGTTMSDDPERTSITWAQFSHLFMPFYTFQYSVGISAAAALSEQVLSGAPGAAERYLHFLHAGGSDYPLALFTRAGVDMATPAPVEKAFDVLARTVDALDELAG